MTQQCVVCLKGGLGNQLFQLAAGLAHCAAAGLQPAAVHVRPDERYWDSFLSNCAQFLADEGIVPYWRVQQDAECLWDEPHFHYTPIPPSATALSGYFQCSRYFAAVAPHIRALFRPADTVHAAMLHRHAALLRPHIAAIHVRRGDYVQLPMHGILDVPWYLRAARVLLDEAPHIESFAVFSDDPGWCQTNLAALAELRPLKVVAEPDAAVALHLLSQFEFYVLSNSTFSWWGAWLGHPAAMVVAPARWFGPGGPTDFQDIYEPSWLLVE